MYSHAGHGQDGSPRITDGRLTAERITATRYRRDPRAPFINFPGFPMPYAHVRVPPSSAGELLPRVFPAETPPGLPYLFPEEQQGPGRDSVLARALLVRFRSGAGLHPQDAAEADLWMNRVGRAVRSGFVSGVGQVGGQGLDRPQLVRR